MTTTAGRPPARRKAVADKEPDFIGKHELARELCCHPNTIVRWIRDGVLPPPHSRPGGKHPLWLRKHYEAFKRQRRWPPEAFWNRQGRAGESPAAG